MSDNNKLNNNINNNIKTNTNNYSNSSNSSNSNNSSAMDLNPNNLSFAPKTGVAFTNDWIDLDDVFSSKLTTTTTTTTTIMLLLLSLYRLLFSTRFRFLAIL